MSAPTITAAAAPDTTPEWIKAHAAIIADLDDTPDYVVYPLGNAIAIEQFSPYSGWTPVRFIEEGEDADAILCGLLYGEAL